MTGKKLGGITGCIACVALVLLSSLTAGAAKHKIRPGDTLWDLAKKHRTTPKALARANGISENAVLGLGKSLIVPGKSPSRRSSRHTRSRRARVASGTILVHTSFDNACLRSRPGPHCSKIAVLPAGTTAKRLGRSGNWLKIALRDGRCGFVHRPLIALGAAPSADEPASSAAQVSEPSSRASTLIRTALACRGARYRRGGTSRGGFDCSGFTRYVFARYGVRLPHSSAAQARLGTPVSRSELREGDLVFFHTYRRGISHVGIYIGGNRFVHASTHGRGVTVDSLGSAYYAPRYRGARRVSRLTQSKQCASTAAQ